MKIIVLTLSLCLLTSSIAIAQPTTQTQSEAQVSFIPKKGKPAPRNSWSGASR